ncbi:MAG: ABC transporter substrate-binding protein [Solobacterium sp.]|nr:ABC transporter substrate-binding protein [Solobacterium sp.]
MNSRKMIKAVLSGILALSVTGCGSSSGNDAQAQASAQAKETVMNIVSSDELSETSQIRDTLNIGYSSLWESLTPFRTNANNKNLYSYALYETLAKKTSEGEYIPWTAKSWTMHEDGKTYDVELYENITDSAGNNIKADDVVWFLNESAVRGLKPSFTNLDTAETTGDYTFTVTLKNDMYGSWEKILTDTFVFSRKEFEASGDEFAMHPVTTSAYVVEEYTPQSSLKMKLRDDYWNPDAPAVNRSNVREVTFQQIAEASQAGIAMEKGIVDAFINIDANTLKQFTGDSNYLVHKGLSANGVQLYFSGVDSKLIQQDVHLRRAIAYIINAEAILQAVYGGYASLMYDVNPEVNDGYLQEWKNEEYFPYDPAKAKEELEQSGYKGEELVLMCSSNASMSRMAQMIQNNCIEIGINIKLEPLDNAGFSGQRLDGNNYDLIIISNGADSLTNFWNTRFDSTTYKLGDATSRNDQTLTDLIHQAGTHDGFNQENINLVRNYIKDNMYGYGIAHPQSLDLINAGVNAKEYVETSFGTVDLLSSVY